MTQPTIDWTHFPTPEVNNMQDLTAAIRDLAAAVDNLAAETQLSRPKEVVVNVVDPNIERVDPDDPEAVEKFWYDNGGEITVSGIDINELHGAFVERLTARPKTLEDVPQGWVAVLDPPRLLPQADAEAVDIFVDEGVRVRKVWREPGVEGPWSWDWEFLDETEKDGDEPWVGDHRQIEALGLTYEDFAAPEA